MNHFLMLFMKNWLMDFSNLFFVDDWLVNFMNDVLMMFMNYVLVMLMNHILMMLVDYISVVLLDNWLQNMAINFGWLLRRLHYCLTLIDINDWFFIMPYYCSLLVIRLFNYRFLWVRNFDSWRIFWQLFKMALTDQVQLPLGLGQLSGEIGGAMWVRGVVGRWEECGKCRGC